MVNAFAVPVFFIVFRETLETSIIVSVLLSFLKQQLGPDRDKTVYKKLRNQVCAPWKDFLHRNFHLPLFEYRFGGAHL